MRVLCFLSQFVEIDNANVRQHSSLGNAGTEHLGEVEKQYNRIEELNSNDQVTEATRTEHMWASNELLDITEAIPYHELFIHSFEELLPRGLRN